MHGQLSEFLAQPGPPTCPYLRQAIWLDGLLRAYLGSLGKGRGGYTDHMADRTYPTFNYLEGPTPPTAVLHRFLRLTFEPVTPRLPNVRTRGVCETQRAKSTFAGKRMRRE